MEEKNCRAQIQAIDDQLRELMLKRASVLQEHVARGGYRKAVWNDFQEVEKLDVENVRVVYQGVEGAYSHQAMRMFFGTDVDCFKVTTFEQAAAAVENGDADYAVLPLENTTGGAVGDVMDLQMKYHLYSVALVDLPIQHELLGIPGTKIEDVQVVHSHPQAIAQCIDFLENYPQWARVPMSNTAASAKFVAETGDNHHAAIASTLSGELYGLVPLARQIATNKYNTTRFIVASSRKIYSRNASKVSICFETEHVSGALYRILSHIMFNELNMTKIESRPVPGRNFEYRFYVDFNGNLRDPRVQSALWAIKRETKICRILGNMIEPG